MAAATDAVLSRSPRSKSLPDPARQNSSEHVGKIRRGDIRSAARLMRDLDDNMPSSREVLKRLFTVPIDLFYRQLSEFDRK